MVSMEPYLVIDTKKLHDLKDIYEQNLLEICTQLHPLDPYSHKSIKENFHKLLDIDLKDVKIATISSYLSSYDHDTEEYDMINGVILFLKQLYTLRNYIYCLIRHETNGRVYLRHHEEQWVLPNKRPLSLNPEIIDCITQSEGVSL